MKELARNLLTNRLNMDVSRRRFLQGAAGLATVTVIGAPFSGASAAEKKLGGPLNFFGYDGEQGQNVAKSFLERTASS